MVVSAQSVQITEGTRTMIEEHLYVWRHVLDGIDMEGIDSALPKYRD